MSIAKARDPRPSRLLDGFPPDTRIGARTSSAASNPTCPITSTQVNSRRSPPRSAPIEQDQGLPEPGPRRRDRCFAVEDRPNRNLCSTARPGDMAVRDRIGGDRAAHTRRNLCRGSIEPIPSRSAQRSGALDLRGGIAAGARLGRAVARVDSQRTRAQDQCLGLSQPFMDRKTFIE